MSAYKQCMTLVAKEPFAFLPEGSKRKVEVKAGARFWVTSSATMLTKSGLVSIARDRQPLHYRYSFKPEILAQYFEVSQ
jgi:hypothetical protein